MSDFIRKCPISDRQAQLKPNSDQCQYIKSKNPTFSDSFAFSDRVRLVLGKRKATPWAERIGIPPGTRNRMLKDAGTPPTHETLARIMHAENVSVSWLLGADCPPFIVLRTIDDMDTANAVSAHLDDSDEWNISIISDADMCAIVLHQPAEIGDEEHLIKYTAIEVIAGPFGFSTANAIRQKREPDQIETRMTDAATMRDIYAGNLGTFALLGDANTPGIISTHHRRNECPDIADLIASPTRRVAEPRAAYGVAEQLREAWPLMQAIEQDTLGRMLKPIIEDAEKRRSNLQPK